MIRVILFFGLLIAADAVYGQATLSNSGTGFGGMVRVNNAEGESSKKRGSYVGQHIFGDSVTFAMNQFERTCIYYTQTTGAYAVEQENIIKPTIYKKIKELDKYFVKEATAGRMMVNDARSRDLKMLALGVKLHFFDTNEVDKNLKKIKDPLKVEEYLKSLKINE